jgi:hypothetical protein
VVVGLRQIRHEADVLAADTSTRPGIRQATGRPPKTYVHASEENPQRDQAALAKIHKIA